VSYTSKIETQYLAQRTNWNEGLRVRVHRAISWLKASEKYAGNDVDVAFLSTVNAANACWADNQGKDRDGIAELVKRLRGTEALKKIWMILASKEGSEWTDMLIGNKYLYWEYAEFLRGELDEEQWEEKALRNYKNAQQAAREKRFDYLLRFCLSQCVSQRGQIAHGFSTYESSANRKPLKLTTTVLPKIVGQILLEMMKSPDKDWGVTPWLYQDEKYKGAFKRR
jgi:hypothetical protein